MYHDITGEDRWRWKDVMPGDLVHSPFTHAFAVRDFATRTEDTKVFNLRDGLLLVLTRIDGCPGDATYGDPTAFVTFIVWSRHGPLVIVHPKD
jgi:hypothetical protein